MGGFFKKIGNKMFGSSGSQGNAANAGMPYLNQIPGVGRQYYDPYIAQGQEGGNMANPVYNQMTQNPNDFLNSMMRNYSPSEGYKHQEGRMSQAIRNSASSGGFAGTPFDQEQQASMVQGLLSQDMQQFLSNLLDVQGKGLSGQENRMSRGYNASGNLADYLGSNLGQQAGMAFQGQGQQNANRAGRRNAWLNMIGQAAGAAAGSGGGKPNSINAKGDYSQHMDMMNRYGGY